MTEVGVLVLWSFVAVVWVISLVFQVLTWRVRRQILDEAREFHARLEKLKADSEKREAVYWETIGRINEEAPWLLPEELRAVFKREDAN